MNLKPKVARELFSLLCIALGGAFIGRAVEHHRLDHKWTELRRLESVERKAARLELLTARVAAAGPGNRMLFIGDSLTRRWETTGAATWTNLVRNYGALNLGVDGETTRQILARAKSYDFSRIQPRTIVVTAGANDKGTKQEKDQDRFDLRLFLYTTFTNADIVMPEVFEGDLTTADGVHLNEEGYRCVARVLGERGLLPTKTHEN